MVLNMILNSTNSIDKVNFNIIKTKKILNLFYGNKQKHFFVKINLNLIYCKSVYYCIVFILKR